MNRRLCIYHGNCADGFGAAWIVRQFFKTTGLDIPDFHAGFYGKPPPDVVGKDVIIVDFSYKRPVLLEMAEDARSILILDHHKTAEEDLKDLPQNVVAQFDMTRSGARLAWDWYFTGERSPRLIDVIEDRDLWKFKLGQDFTREVQACLFSFPYDFDTWSGLMAMNIQNMRRDGAAIERKHFKDIRELIAANMQWWTIGDYPDIPVLNVPYMWTSDAGHIMWKENDTKFAACYWDIPGGRTFSLRSRPDFDVSAVAKQYGGGGHKNAAGFTVDLNHPLARRESGATERTKLPTDVQPAPNGS